MWNEMGAVYPWFPRFLVSAAGIAPFAMLVWLGAILGLRGTSHCTLAAIGLCISIIMVFAGGGYIGIPLAFALVWVLLSAHYSLYEPTGLRAMREDLVAYGFWERERKRWCRAYMSTMTRNVLRFPRGLPMLIWVPERHAVKDTTSPTGFSWHPGERLYAPGDVRNTWRVMVERPQEEEL